MSKAYRNYTIAKHNAILNQQIGRSGLLYTVLLFPFFVPTIVEDLGTLHIFTQAMAIFRYIISIIAICLMVIRQHDRPIVWALASFQAIVIISALKTETIYPSYFLSCITFIGYTALILEIYNTNSNKLVYILYIYTCMYLMINFMTKLIYPNGMIAGLVGDNREWFLGTKNHATLYYVVYAACFYQRNTIGHRRSLPETIVFAFITLSLFYISSATSIVISLLVVPYIFINLSNSVRRRLNIVIIVIVIVFLITVVLLGTNNILSNFVSSLVGKSASFTGRRAIWSMALDLIEHNFNGVGVYASFNPWANQTIEVYSAHNTFLDIAVRFGIFAAMLFLIIAVYIVLKYSKNCRNPYVFFFLCSLAASLMEALQQSYMFWTLIALCVSHGAIYMKTNK